MNLYPMLSPAARALPDNLRAPGVALASDPLALLFRPFAHLDVPRLYDTYAGLIDFFVFFLVFLGLSQVTLGKQFPGRGGSALSVGVALTLAISLLLAEQALGFSLASLGPLAAGLILAVLGVLVYRFLHQAGLARAQAGGWAYLVLFLLMLGIMPGFFEWLSNDAPALGALMVLLLLAGAIAAGSSIFRGRTPGPLRQASERAEAYREERDEDRHVLKTEDRTSRREVAPVVKAQVKDSKQLIKELQRCERALRKRGNEGTVREAVTRDLDNLLPEEHALAGRLGELRTLQERLRHADEHLVKEHLPKGGRNLDDAARATLQQALDREIGRVHAAERIEKVESVLVKNREQTAQFLEEARTALGNTQVDRARKALHRAVGLEKRSLQLSRDLDALEQHLHKVLRRELKALA